jgi:hypothetical protein
MKTTAALLSAFLVLASAGAALANPVDPQQECREFNTLVTIAGQQQQAHGTACLQPDGTWKIEQSIAGQAPQTYVVPPQVYLPYYPPSYLGSVQDTCNKWSQRHIGMKSLYGTALSCPRPQIHRAFHDHRAVDSSPSCPEMAPPMVADKSRVFNEVEERL